MPDFQHPADRLIYTHNAGGEGASPEISCDILLRF